MKPHAQDTPRNFNSKLNVDKNRACVLCCSQGPRNDTMQIPNKMPSLFFKAKIWIILLLQNPRLILISQYEAYHVFLQNATAIFMMA